MGTLALLRPAGIREIVLVTHGTHMPRALREFRAAAAADAASAPVRITPATMGEAGPADSALLRWLPSSEGVVRMRATLHEVLAQAGRSALTRPARRDEAPITWKVIGASWTT